MEKQTRARHILQELICHSPYTLLGAVTGIVFMLIFRDLGQETGAVLFRVFHPTHVVLSALVTTAIYNLHARKKSLVRLIIIGYAGSIGIATLSDCIIPYFGEELLGVAIPTHADVHNVPGTEPGHVHGPECDHDTMADAARPEPVHVHGPDCEHGPAALSDKGHAHGPGLHLGFIEEWYLVNPAALLGILIGWKIPRTRFPHALHILVSTWASSAHIMMNTQAELSAVILLGMFLVLFIAVWFPCCLSDIIFPLLFVQGDIGQTCRCTCAHGHDHEKREEDGHVAV